MESNNAHFFNLQSSIALENAFQEKQRMQSHLRLGNVPAHFAHPITPAMMNPVAPVVMEVDAVMIAPNHNTPEYQTSSRADDRNNGIPNLEDFTTDEESLINGAQMPNSVVRSYNLKVAARNAQFTRRLAVKTAKAARIAATATAVAARTPR